MPIALLKSFHIISMVAWFAGLFYLPRLFVYHCEATDSISIERFKIMERKLYYAITWPSAFFTTVLGLALFSSNPNYYLHAGWFHLKLGMVLLVWAYHLSCGHYLRAFRADKNRKNSLFFRLFNEVPVILLVSIVLLVEIKPF